MPPIGCRLLVLAVDNDALTLMGTVALIEDLDHEVVRVLSGTDALSRFEHEGSFDIVVTDQAVAKMAGVQLAERLRERQPNLPIIITIGHADLPSGNAHLFDERLSKPFTRAGLKRAIASVLCD